MSLEVTFEGVSPDPWGGTRAGSPSQGTGPGGLGHGLERSPQTGGVLVSRTVQLEIEAQAVKEPDEIERAAAAESKPEEQATA